MKESPNARAYLLMSMFLRKIFYIAVMITFAPMIGCTHILIVVRPYQRLQDNLIELTNQMVFMILVVFLFFLNQPQHWDALWESVVMMIVTANNLIVVLILFSEYLSVNRIVFMVKPLISKIAK